MKKFNRFLLFCITFTAFSLFSSTKGWAQNKYILYVTYKLPTNPDLVSDASNLESECTNKYAVCMQSCEIGDGKVNCQNRCEQAFRQCLLGIKGVKFWLAACKEGNCKTVDDILPLTRAEALDSRLNAIFNEIKPGYYSMTGTYVIVSSGNCIFRRTSDNAEINFQGSDFIGKAISNYHKAPVPARDNKSALYLAIENGQYDLMESLLLRGVGVNGSNNNHMPISIAQKLGRWDIVKKLILEYNADVNNFKGNIIGIEYSVLGEAVEKDDMNMVKLILEHGGEINGSSFGGGGGVPLEIALKNNNIPMMEFLISEGADVNGRYMTGNTYFGHVAAGGNLSLVKILIQNGADINRKNLFGETPLDLAEKNKHKEVADFLRSKGAKNGQ